MLGDCFYQTKNYQSAIDCFNKLSGNQYSYIKLLNIGLCLTKSYLYDEAQEIISLITPDKAGYSIYNEALWAKCLCHLDTCKYSELLESCKEGYILFDDIRFKDLLPLIYCYLGRNRNAIKALELINRRTEFQHKAKLLLGLESYPDTRTMNITPIYIKRLEASDNEEYMFKVEHKRVTNPQDADVIAKEIIRYSDKNDSFFISPTMNVSLH